MYIDVTNNNYGIATTTYADYVAISNPDFNLYDITDETIYHTGSIDCYRHNKSLDEHILMYTLTRPYIGVLLATETSSIITTETSFNLSLDGNMQDVQNSFGKSLDLTNSQLAIGCPYFLQQYSGFNLTSSYSGSAVYVFELGTTSSLIQSIPNSSSVSSSFGTSVAINNDWLAVGCPAENNNSGSVFIYNNTSGSWNLYQEISSSNIIPNANFGYSLKLNKDSNTPSGRLVVGCGNPAQCKAFFFEFSGSQWNQTYTFTPNYDIYPLTFGNYTPYNLVRNITSSFGSSVSTYGDSVIIGEYLDRTVYEYSGSANYQQGSVSIFERCTPSSSLFDLVYKTYGNENILRSNNFGYSVDMFDLKAVSGIPRINQNSITSNYIETTLAQSYQDTDLLNSLDGQVALFTCESGSWGIENIFQKKKEYLSPYREFGHNVSIADYSMVVGAPLLISSSTAPSVTLTITSSNGVNLDDICGKSYIYNLNNLQESFHIGNVFYRNGKIVLMTSGSVFQDLFSTDTTSSYNLNFNGEHTIYEKQVICSISPGEFNVSTNPTALEQIQYTFDLNSNGQFDFEDVDIILRYMEYKNTQALGLPFSTDWSSSISLADDEISLINYYKSLPTFNESYIAQQVLNYIPIWDVDDISIQTDLDVNGDNVIDIRDMNIVWKYFSNRLNQKNYPTYITPNSTRKTLNLAIDYLDGLSGRNKPQNITPEFFNYKNNVSNDPTGSYLNVMATTIGLYSGLELIAVAKLGNPIKLDGSLPVNFLIKMDF
jgi:hypothetical protein